MFSFVLVVDRDSDASFIKMCKNIVQQVGRVGRWAKRNEEKRADMMDRGAQRWAETSKGEQRSGEWVGLGRGRQAGRGDLF
jgi:hypothetical protein